MNERSPPGAAKSVRHGQRQRKMRAQQQRALATRAAILNAAIAEFAERGFEGASIRRIADRTGLQHPLITYHYRSKDILWRAAAEHAFTRIREEWDLRVPEQAPVSTLERGGLSDLAEGQRVRMQIGQGQKGPEARSIELLD